MSDQYDGPLMAQRILRLQAERDVLREKLQEWWKAFEGHLYIKTEKYSELIAERDALLETLRPFAALYCEHHERMRDDQPIVGINDATITVGDMRRAKAAIDAARGDK